MKNICNKSMTFQECELAILRTAVDKAEAKIGKRVVSSPDIKKMIVILENFLKHKNLICYGGIAINSILPKQDQFYDIDIEIPDYDFFSPNALNDAKELADIYIKEGFDEVEAKTGQHHGTFKVFVNFIGIADITFLHKDIFNSLKLDAIRVSGILFAPPNFLRMSMYLELSRPAGDISRWEKVLKRLTLLNNNYPLHSAHCETIDLQRDMENKKNEDTIYNTVRDTFINQGVVFFGGYALSLYLQYMPKKLQKKIEKIPDFDVLSEEPEITSTILKERLHDVGIKNVKVIKREAIGEIVAPHYQILVGKDTIAFIYKPIACHSYNVISINKQKVKIATIDTMLSFYLAFLYSARNYYDTERIVCMAQYLFTVQQHNRLKQKGLLRRFSIDCYGHQTTLEEMKAEKAEKFKEFKKLNAVQREKDTDYEEWFLRYRPGDSKINKYIKNDTKKNTKINKYIKNTKINKYIKKNIKKNTKKNTKINKNIKKNTKKRIRVRGRGGLFY
jgi:hypothetical protein